MIIFKIIKKLIKFYLLKLFFDLNENTLELI